MTKREITTWLTIAYTTLLTTLSLIKISVPTPELNAIGFDKIIHFGLYFGLNTLLISMVITYRGGVKTAQIAYTTAVAILYGVIIEFIQGCVGREFDLFDMAANTIGTIVAGVLLSMHQTKAILKKILS